MLFINIFCGEGGGWEVRSCMKLADYGKIKFIIKYFVFFLVGRGWGKGGEGMQTVANSI
jgi:hypothetical protein